MGTMLDVIHHNIGNSSSLHQAHHGCAPRLGIPCLPEAQEPIRVRVQVRWYGDISPEPQASSPLKLDPGRLPVGTLLNCLV